MSEGNSQEQKVQVSFDKDMIVAAFNENIKLITTSMIKEAVSQDSLKETIVGALKKKWLSDKDTYLETEIRDAMHHALWKSVQKAMEEAGILEYITQVAKEFMITDEFKKTVAERVAETIKTTTFFVKPTKTEASQ